MDEVFSVILGALGLVARSVVWVIIGAIQYGFLPLGWYIGWPICRLLSLFKFPRFSIDQREMASNGTEAFVSLMGYLVPFLLGLFLAPWEGMFGI